VHVILHDIPKILNGLDRTRKNSRNHTIFTSCLTSRLIFRRGIRAQNSARKQHPQPILHKAGLKYFSFLP